MIILDTNVLSALMSPAAEALDPWLRTVRATEIYTTVITRAEIRYGIERLPEGKRRSELADRADRLFIDIANRTLPFSTEAADHYGVLVARRERGGRPISVPDAMIASIAYVQRAAVVTRNVRDFDETGVQVIDPFAVRGG